MAFLHMTSATRPTRVKGLTGLDWAKIKKQFSPEKCLQWLYMVKKHQNRQCFYQLGENPKSVILLIMVIMVICYRNITILSKITKNGNMTLLGN